MIADLQHATLDDCLATCTLCLPLTRAEMDNAMLFLASSASS